MDDWSSRSQAPRPTERTKESTMLETPHKVLQFLLRLGYPPEDVCQTLMETFGTTEGLAREMARVYARRIQEEDIDFAHTVIEHEAAIAAEWRE